MKNYCYESKTENPHTHARSTDSKRASGISLAVLAAICRSARQEKNKIGLYNNLFRYRVARSMDKILFLNLHS